MQKLFNKILVPVDFSKISVRALEKAVEMANEYHCDIYLLHVVTVSPFAVVAMTEGHWVLPYDHIDNRHQLEQELENLAAPYLPMLEEGRKMHNYVVKGLWNDVIIDFVHEHKIDLILVGQRENFFRKRKMLIDANAVAERTFIPVITIPGNRKLVKLYSIVIPVTDFLPVKKLMYGIEYFCNTLPVSRETIPGIRLCLPGFTMTRSAAFLCAYSFTASATLAPTTVAISTGTWQLSRIS